MNRVFLRAEDVPLPSWARAAESFVRKVLETLGRKNPALRNQEVSILFCSNRYIKSLNAQYRNRDEPTDVLSFPLGGTEGHGKRSGPKLAGDIVVSLDALEENTRFFKVSPDEELRRLLIHGVLHLFGSDHGTNKPEEPMLKTQEEILSCLAGERIQENVP